MAAQNPTSYDDVRCDVADKQGAQPKPQPSAEWGRRAVGLAASIGKTKQDLARAAGYTGGPRDPTIDRLMRGQGSFKLAWAIKRALREWGLDVSSLPSFDEDESEMPAWRRDWMKLGDDLHRLASDERFLVEVQRIRDVIRAHELVAEGTGETKRRR